MRHVERDAFLSERRVVNIYGRKAQWSCKSTFPWIKGCKNFYQVITGSSEGSHENRNGWFVWSGETGNANNHWRLRICKGGSVRPRYIDEEKNSENVDKEAQRSNYTQSGISTKESSAFKLKGRETTRAPYRVENSRNNGEECQRRNFKEQALLQSRWTRNIKQWEK